MAEVYTYNGTHLTLVDAEETIEFTQRADHGEPGGGTFILDDVAGTQAIVGQKDFSVTQSSCSFPLTFRGFIGPRTYGRNGVAPNVTAARKITVAVEDLNTMLGHLLIHQQAGMTKAEGGKRPAETVAARGAWLMASPFVDFADNGRCDFPSTKGMDKADYRYMHAGDVLTDMALAAEGYNYHVNDWGSGPELTFRDDNASTADTSTLRISNVLADASGVTLNPKHTAALTRNPARVISKLAEGYDGKTIVEDRPATATAFNGERSGTASNSLVKTAAKAREEATSQLWQVHTEDDVIECEIDVVTSAQINLILAGMRIQAKFSHLATEGYGSFTWFRVLERTVRPLNAEGALYELDLKLSPQEEGLPAGAIVQSAFAVGTHFGLTFGFPNPVTPGNHLVAMIGSKLGDGDEPPPNTEASLPRLGAGAWTRFNGSTLTRAGAVPTSPDTVNACAAYWKVADSTEQECYFAVNGGVVGVFELSGSDPASATVYDEDRTTGTANYTIGSVGSPAAGDVVLAIWVLGNISDSADWSWDYANSYPWQSFDPNPNIAAGWTTGISKWAGGDNMSLNAVLPGTPWVVIAYALGDGAVLSATLTPGQSAHIFGGIALVIPA